MAAGIYHAIAVFVITYGAIGLETCAIELDNPFGDDPNDLDNLAMAHTCIEDVYLTILDVDKEEYAERLRQRMHIGTDHGEKESEGLHGGKVELDP